MYNPLNLNFAYGKPTATGLIKQSPEDFTVEEIPGFELTGEGEHLFLLIEKRGRNTEDVAKELTTVMQRATRDVSWAGLKDRHAITKQWFCVHCPRADIPDLTVLNGKGWKVLASKRHARKLKKGSLWGNSFQITIRNVQGREEIERRLLQVREYGVPNYFGSQRFGYKGNNLVRAKQLLLEGMKVKNRFLKGMYYSAARAFFFNLLLSERIRFQSWNKALPGDVMQLSGTKSLFTTETIDELIAARVRAFDISPALPLWGAGEELAKGEAFALQKQVLMAYQPWCDALVLRGLERAWRPQVLQVRELVGEWRDDILILGFRLAAGGYATSVIRELVDSCDEAMI